MNSKSIRFQEFVSDIYKFDFQEFLDKFETYGFDDEEEEQEYTDRYIGDLYAFLRDKVESDFKFLKKFYKDEVEESGTNDLSVTVDIVKDTITFTGDYNTLAVYCIECINGYGMFRFDSLQELYDSIPAVTDDEKFQCAIDHLHWLKHFEEIYGTTQEAFSGRAIDRQREYQSRYY